MIKLFKILSEIKITGNIWKDPKKVKQQIALLRAIDEAPILDLKIGKYDVTKGQKGFEYSWEEAIRDKKISTPTANIVLSLCNILGIKPEKVYTGYYLYNSPTRAETTEKENIPNIGEFNKSHQIYPKSRNLKSTYITMTYKDEPIIIAQRQTKDNRAGQPYIYSKYVRLANTNRTMPYFIPSKYSLGRNIISKENLLKLLKIKDD